MEDRRVKFHSKGQKSFGRTNWVIARMSSPKVDIENPELVGKVKFTKPVVFHKTR